ncbi:hypothetical protein [Streptomyces erythrochromogenes]|uniref:hypothetical protein n=1 Tax=Streptomyces erythrochromogenes TaxID=285574 RepID=UPI0034481711
MDNSLGLFVHGQMLGTPVPVSDTWVRAAAAVGDFHAQAKVALLLEPLPGDIATSFAPVQEGVAEPDMPVWVGEVLAGRYKMALRDMRVSTGFLGNVDMGFGVPQDVAGWATILHGSAQRLSVPRPRGSAGSGSGSCVRRIPALGRGQAS